jgi:hypothetical protein
MALGCMSNHNEPNTSLGLNQDRLKDLSYPYFFDDETDPTSTTSSPALFLRSVYTPLDYALSEIEERRKDFKLRRAVEKYLNGDIPRHFNSKKPVLYLSRHVATPNYETLRFIEITKGYNHPKLIGQDTADIFTSNNLLKRALGKMPIMKGTARNGDEIIENFTVVNFNKAQGKKLRYVKTATGAPLTSFHNALLTSIYPSGYKLVNESAWIDRNHRKNLLLHYKKFLSLMITQGVMFEYYEDSEHDFVNEILRPAFADVTKRFGCKPLISDLVPHEKQLERDWNSYPSVVYQFVKRHLDGEM